MYHTAFLAQRKKYESLMQYAAFRCAIPGVLDQEDLYQEALIILDKMFRKYDFAPDTDDFRKLFKTELWHGLCKVVAKYNTQARDHKMSVSANTNDEGGYDLFSRTSGDYGDPEEILVYAEGVKRSEKLLSMLMGSISEDAIAVLELTLDQDGMRDALRSEYTRLPARLCSSMLGEYLGWDKARVSRAKAELESRALAVAEILGIVR